VAARLRVLFGPRHVVFIIIIIIIIIIIELFPSP
jgi:hypothetical protein